MYFRVKRTPHFERIKILLKEHIKMSLRTTSTFSSQAVKVLKERDFLLDSREKLSYIYDDPTLILFYDASIFSQTLQPIFLEAAIATGVNPVFAAVNLTTEIDIASKLGYLRMTVDHPLHWVGVATPPFVIVYRWGWPQAFYNGEYSPELLNQYAIKLAGQPGYQEKIYERDPSNPLAVVGASGVNSGIYLPPVAIQVPISQNPSNSFVSSTPPPPSGEEESPQRVFLSPPSQSTSTPPERLGNRTITRSAKSQR